MSMSKADILYSHIIASIDKIQVRRKDEWYNEPLTKDILKMVSELYNIAEMVPEDDQGDFEDE